MSGGCLEFCGLGNQHLTITLSIPYRWSTNDLRTNASVLLNNIGLSSASIDLAVRQGALDAHGGVIGGYIEVSEIAVDGRLSKCNCEILKMPNSALERTYNIVISQQQSNK